MNWTTSSWRAVSPSATIGRRAHRPCFGRDLLCRPKTASLIPPSTLARRFRRITLFETLPFSLRNSQHTTPPELSPTSRSGCTSRPLFLRRRRSPRPQSRAHTTSSNARRHTERSRRKASWRGWRAWPRGSAALLLPKVRSLLLCLWLRLGRARGLPQYTRMNLNDYGEELIRKEPLRRKSEITNRPHSETGAHGLRSRPALGS